MVRFPDLFTLEAPVELIEEFSTDRGAFKFSEKVPDGFVQADPSLLSHLKLGCELDETPLGFLRELDRGHLL